ncbi:MAG: phosphatase PAP2 family protein [Bacteroidales bacterium]|nr:phosphatase PAP2 family protein [Bacteroidales bacterium]
MSQTDPNKLKAALCCVGALAIWLGVTALFIGFRVEHVVLAVLIAVLFFASNPTRRLIVALVPFFLFGISYDWMNLCPNYNVNPVDVADLYNAEKRIFGIAYGGAMLTPNEFWALHTQPWLDVLCGIFYLCWVPVPIFFGLWLYFRGQKASYLHFALVFLLVNLLGFSFYYVHPAAPPWYVANHGFEAVPGTLGEVAGLGAFDRITGLNIFDGLYARNSNVFAALPSLHSAYTLVAFIYSLRSRCGLGWKIALGIITVGIWFTAVYTSHHYIIDVLGGIACALVGFLLFEYALMRIPAFNHFIARYVAYIKG